jgi:hypothetical protein
MDVERHPRIAGCRVDMGAYEYAAAPLGCPGPGLCPCIDEADIRADLNGDGCIDADDNALEATTALHFVVNSDDDSGNGLEDYLDDGPVENEDDLVEIRLSAKCPALDPATGCVYEQRCNDGDPCTFDTCNPQTGACGHQDIAIPTDDCAQFGWHLSGTPPTRLLVNDDDDNGNGVADYLDPGPVAGENDLVLVPISIGWGPLFPGCVCEDTSHYHVDAGGSGAFALFLHPDQTGDASSFGPGAAPAAVYASGQRPSSACGAPLSLMAVCCYDVHSCTLTTDPVVVLALDSLTWEKADPGNADLEANAPINGGVRIFPDKLSPGDSTPTIRQQVKLVATVAPPVAGVTVYFKVFDVDDPFDQLNPDMPNVSLIDPTPTSGPDNRPSGEAPWTPPSAPTTDSEGKARVTFTVSMQPGNNYRAGASLIQAALTQNTTYGGQTVNPQQHADALNVLGGSWSGYSTPLTWSQMLTVWRKLTLEVDSMDRESETAAGRFPVYFEQDRCAVASVTANSPGAGFTTVQCGPDPVDPNRVAFPGTNFFEGGAFWCVDGGQQWLIVRSAVGPQSYTLTLWGNPGTGIIGQQCKIRDDDPYFGSGNPGQLPVTTVLDDNIRNAYRDAYIEAVEADSSLNLVNLVPWESHLTGLQLESEYLTFTGTSSQWDLTSYDQFWARHVVMCYQPGRNDAGDGDSDENCGISQNCLQSAAPYPVLGLPVLPNLPQVYGYTWRVDTGYQTALSTVYVETIRDQWTDATSLLRWQVVAHEIGHKIVNPSGQVSSGEHTEGGLMTGEPEAGQLQNIPALHNFTVTTLKRFRETKRW